MTFLRPPERASRRRDSLVVFHEHGKGFLTRFLRRDFRHVFAVLRGERHWIMVDPRAGVPVVEVVADADFDLAGFYRDCGFKVIELEHRTRPSKWPWMCATCVGSVKKVLGIQSWRIQTPWQFYRYLIEEEN